MLVSNNYIWWDDNPVKENIGDKRSIIFYKMNENYLKNSFIFFFIEILENLISVFDFIMII